MTVKGCAWVNLLASWYETNTALRKATNGRHQMLQITAEPVQFPHVEDITGAKCLETGFQAWAVIALSRGLILVNLLRGNAGGAQGVELQVQGL